MQTERAESQPADERWVDRPRLFEHDLERELFTPERIDELCRQGWMETTKGGRDVTHAAKRHLDVQHADPGRERPGLNDPVFTDPRFPVIEDAMARPIQYRIYNPDQWAGPEYAAARDRIMELAAPDERHGRINVTTVIRVFSPRAVVALHTDVDLKLVCGLSGHTVWHVRPPQETTTLEHEDLLHGRFFLRWRDSPLEDALPVRGGTGCFVPCRWGHWLDHPTDEPTISFELGFWTYDAVRQRKVYDVNWALRRAGIEPTPPGVIPGRDRLKCRLLDVASRFTGQGAVYRGID